MDLKDRVVVVTGGGSGIGAALATAAAEAGARHVVVTDLDGETARAVAASIGGTGATLDVRDEAAMAELVHATEAAHGSIDLFCSNAGFVTQGGVEESDDVLQALWEVHVMAHVHAARAVLPSMIARGDGYLLNTASAAGLLTQVGSLGYTITKHAAVALAEWLAITHHHQGIGVSVLCPQAVRTNITANSPDARVADPSSGPIGVTPADAVLEADEVARQCIDAIAAERFWVLPHPEVAEQVARRSVTSTAGWWACVATSPASTTADRCPATGWCRAPEARRSGARRSRWAGPGGDGAVPRGTVEAGRRR